MTSLNDLTIAAAAKGLKDGKFTSEELVVAHIDVLDEKRSLNAFITETPEIAIARAKESDIRRRSGEKLGLMDGIPIAIKDLFCTENVLTTAGSHILDGFIPTYESTVTTNLRNAGAVMLGKTNLDEFAMGSANMTSYYGPVKNPWIAQSGAKKGKHLVPGGSSGGSASAVAARIVPGALGTDTGGSIRQPASFTGIVGMKPTYGRCSRWGIVAFSSSLDQAGPLTRTVEDAAIMLGAMSGHDIKDSTSVPFDVPNFTSSLLEGVEGLKIGIPKEYSMEGMPSEIEAIWSKGRSWLEDQGAECIEVSLPHTKYALPTYYIIAPAEASSNLARYDGVRYGLRVNGETLDDMFESTRGEGFGEEVRRRILIGTYVLSAGYYDAYYIKAQKVRTLIANDFKKVFEKVDLLLTPTAPSAAFSIGEKMDDPVAMYLNDIFTVPASLAGLPAISIPSGLDGDGLPLGLHLIAKPFDELSLFRTAKILELAAEFDTKPRIAT
ncbi:MAG: Asp-tRNA(Asn)/Glu-tRNA(Gln) amidotransferase subunit GatA [Pseudomonadota bacterium]|nr:Asp-tRNA(Asn)/Glu-tRNA(Gln) amidotransferase subunit GatA [Pseudomonadota bacterium]